MKKAGFSLAIAFASLLLAQGASATTLSMITYVGSGNECGPGFSSCDVGDLLNLDPAAKVSPVIAKFEFEKGGVEIERGDGYPTTDLTVITISDSALGAGTWTSSVDLGIRFWAAKGGRNFKLHWMIAESDAGKCDSVLTLACFDAAVVVQGGDWSTPARGGSAASAPALSHLTFFNEGDDDTTEMPEPSVIGLLALGLLGIGAMARRRRNVGQAS